MTTTTTPYEALLRLADDGTVKGISLRDIQRTFDDAGKQIAAVMLLPRPIADAAALLAEIFGPEAGSALVQIQTLQDQLAAAQAAARAAQDETAAKSAQIAALQKQLAAKTPAAQPADDTLSKLDAAFQEAIPAEMRGAFAEKYAIVRILVQAGQIDMARHVIEGTEVPDALAAAKAQLLALLPTA